MSEPSSPPSRTSQPGSLSTQGNRSAPYSLRAFAGSIPDGSVVPDGSNALVIRPRLDPLRHLAAAWMHVPASFERPIRKSQTCTQTLCRPGGDPSGDDASRTQPAFWTADPDPVGCPPTSTGLPEGAS